MQPLIQRARPFCRSCLVTLELVFLVPFCVPFPRQLGTELWLSATGDAVSWEHLTKTRDVLGWHEWGRRGVRLSEHTPVHRTAMTTKNCPAPKVHSAERLGIEQLRAVTLLWPVPVGCSSYILQQPRAHANIYAQSQHHGTKIRASQKSTYFYHRWHSENFYDTGIWRCYQNLWCWSYNLLIRQGPTFAKHSYREAPRLKCQRRVYLNVRFPYHGTSIVSASSRNFGTTKPPFLWLNEDKNWETACCSRLVCPHNIG